MHLVVSRSPHIPEAPISTCSPGQEQARGPARVRRDKAEQRGYYHLASMSNNNENVAHANCAGLAPAPILDAPANHLNATIFRATSFLLAWKLTGGF